MKNTSEWSTGSLTKLLLIFYRFNLYLMYFKYIKFFLKFLMKSSKIIASSWKTFVQYNELTFLICWGDCTFIYYWDKPLKFTSHQDLLLLMINYLLAFFSKVLFFLAISFHLDLPFFMNSLSCIAQKSGSKGLFCLST